MKLYLASPFFNKEQEEREMRIKLKLRKCGFEVYSPKEYGIVNNENRKEIFEENLQQIRDCDYVFCITDTKDIGSIWEAGYAFGIGKHIIYYCETLGEGKFNVMLAESGFLVLTDFDKLKDLKEFIEKGERKLYAGNIE